MIPSRKEWRSVALQPQQQQQSAACFMCISPSSRPRSDRPTTSTGRRGASPTRFLTPVLGYEDGRWGTRRPLALVLGCFPPPPHRRRRRRRRLSQREIRVFLACFPLRLSIPTNPTFGRPDQPNQPPRPDLASDGGGAQLSASETSSSSLPCRFLRGIFWLIQKSSQPTSSFFAL